MLPRLISAFLLLTGTPLPGEIGAPTDSAAHETLVARVKREDTLRVLFVGNSYSFKVPESFRALATKEGRKVTVGQVTKGGWTLAKHAESEETLGRIADGHWDVVVLQEQSQTPAFQENQRAQTMYSAARKLSDAVRKAGAIPVFFQTWGHRDGDRRNAALFPNDSQSAMQKRLTEGYRRAAEAAGGAYVIPAGEVWTKALRANGKADLYTKDGSHPAAAGIDLAASVIYCALFDAPIHTKGENARLAESARFSHATSPR